MRSLLIVPPGDAAALGAALASGADALAVENPPAAQDGGPAMFALLPPLDSPACAAALAAAVRQRPRGVVLRESSGGGDVQRLGARLAVEEALAGVADGTTRILAFATESEAAVLALASYRKASARLEALVFSVAPLEARLGIAPGRREAGPLRLARDLTLIAARAAGALALDAPYPDADDFAGLEREARAAAADGFDGKLAVDPRQVAALNAIFSRP